MRENAGGCLVFIRSVSVAEFGCRSVCRRCTILKLCFARERLLDFFNGVDRCVLERDVIACSEIIGVCLSSTGEMPDRRRRPLEKTSAKSACDDGTELWRGDPELANRFKLTQEAPVIVLLEAKLPYSSHARVISTLIDNLADRFTLAVEVSLLR